jgi:tetraacyldisaccharide 4'-kinase
LKIDAQTRSLTRTLNETWEQYGLRVMSGEALGAGAAIMRAGMRAASPIYALAMRARNAKYDRGRGVRRLPRPVVSVGNITTGGTGKTPVVRWLCETLRDAGERPAVLIRGYRATPEDFGDEETMLNSLMNQGGRPEVFVQAQPDRFAGGSELLAEHPEVSLFVMDDGFQHRRLARDFDLVLIDACRPFGFDRVLPAGLLREPLEGLRRADAILITRSDQGGDIDAIVQRVREHNPAAPVFRCAHKHVGLRSREDVLHQPDALRCMKVFLFAGIGNPEGFARQFPKRVGQHWFGDHWWYRTDDLSQLVREAEAAGADLMVTTEKDWVKIAPLYQEFTFPVWRAELAIQFEGEDEAKLFEQIRERVKSRRP